MRYGLSGKCVTESDDKEKQSSKKLDVPPQYRSKADMGKKKKKHAY